jgi:uncharacterized membrane protein YraQ (UPF0718 family)
MSTKSTMTSGGSKPLGILNVLRKIDPVYLAVAGIFLAISIIDQEQLGPLASLTLNNLAHTTVYLLIAITLLAYLKATGAETMVAGIFTGRETRMIFLAALVGGLAPFCSCEVIPFIAGLLALGTPLAPIMAFWLSSPLIDPPTILITAGALGWEFALGKTFFAVGIGILGGLTVNAFTQRGYFSNPLKPNETGTTSLKPLPVATLGPCCQPETPAMDRAPRWKFWQERGRVQEFIFQLQVNGLFLLKWMLFAYSLESLMIAYIPAEGIARILGGDGVLQLVIAAAVGVPAYLNSYIAPPLVSGLMEQGMSPGSGMAFIVAGAISSIPAMTAVFALVRKEVFAAYLSLGFVGAVLSGMLYNLFV